MNSAKRPRSSGRQHRPQHKMRRHRYKPASPNHPPSRRNRAKPRDQKTALRPGRYLRASFGVDKNTKKNTSESPQNKKAQTIGCGNSLYWRCPRGVGSYSHPRGLRKNQMHGQRTNIIITPINPPPARTEGKTVRGSSPRNFSHGESLGQSPPFVRCLKYDGALSIYASSSTAFFAGRLRQFPLEAAPAVISQ